MSAGPRVAVVGATGAVGRIMLEVLAAREFATAELVPFASERSAGRELPGAGTVTGIPAFFSLSTSCSKTFEVTAQAQVTASSVINFAQSDPVVTPGLMGAISSR